MMQKRVFIVHGWGGYPEEGWFPWLKQELETKGFSVLIPAMPDSENPIIEKWVSYLADIVKKPDEQTYFVGHSIGCQTILRYLEKLGDKKAGGAVFVAGWFNLTGLSNEEQNIVRGWLETPIDFNKVRQTTNNFVAIFSTNDPWVSLTEQNIFKDKLRAKIIIEENKKHFSGEDGVNKLQNALGSILEIAE